ncbi:MAG: glycosyltransferase [Chloroflexota bacterium]
MEIALDGRLLHRRTSGLERYIRSLISGLSRGFDQHTYRVYVEWPAAPELEFGPAARLTPVRGDDGLLADLLQRNCDVYHSLWLGNSLRHYLPLRIAPASVITVPDLILYHHPEYLPERERTRYQALLSEGTRWADVVMVYSQHTKADVVTTLGLPEERIAVVPLGTGPQFQPSRNPAAVEWVRRKYGIDGPFILHVGKDYPHKNLLALARAFITLKRSSLPDHRLVLAGESVWHETRTQLRYLFNSAGVSEAVIFADHVLDDDLPALYQGADVFAFPSLYEGFGLPPLEAMACGTPVVCSRATSLPEVIGDAAVVVNAADAGALAAGIELAARDGGARRGLISAGLEQARQFDWQRAAAGTERACRQAAELAQHRQKARVPANWAIAPCARDFAALRGRGAEIVGETVARLTLLIVNASPPLSTVGPAMLQAQWLHRQSLLARLAEAARARNWQVRLIELAALDDIARLESVVAFLRPRALLCGGLLADGHDLESLLAAVQRHSPTTSLFVAEGSYSTAPPPSARVVSLPAADPLAGGLGVALAELAPGTEEPLVDADLDVDAYALSRSGALAARFGVAPPLAVVVGGESWPDELVARRDPAAIVHEVADLRQSHAVRSWLLTGADPFADAPWSAEFSRLCQSQDLRLPLVCVATASSVMQAGATLLASLRSGGLHAVLLRPDRAAGVGLEAVAERERRYAEAARLLRSCGVRVFASYVLGGPGESIGDVLATVRLAHSVGADTYDPVVYGAWDYAPTPSQSDMAAARPTEMDESFLRAAAAESCRPAANDFDAPRHAIELRRERDETERTLRRQFEQSLEQSRELLTDYRERCSDLEAKLVVLQTHLKTLVGLVSCRETAGPEAAPPAVEG